MELNLPKQPLVYFISLSCFVPQCEMEMRALGTIAAVTVYQLPPELAKPNPTNEV